MEQATLNTVISIGIGLYVALLSWVFIDNRNNTNKKIDEVKAAADKEIDELKRKLELTDAHLREFENTKFREIMDSLSLLSNDMAVIKNEITNMKSK